MHGGKGPAQVRCTGEIPPISLFLPRWSGVEWTGGFVSFYSSLFQDGGRRHWQHRNQIRSHSAVRGKIISGEGGERPSLSLLIAPKNLLSGGASVLIFRVVAQATCSKLKSTIDAASEVNLRAISVTDPPSRRGTLASLPRVGLDSNGLVDPPHFSSPRE